MVNVVKENPEKPQPRYVKIKTLQFDYKEYKNSIHNDDINAKPNAWVEEVGFVGCIQTHSLQEAKDYVMHMKM